MKVYSLMNQKGGVGKSTIAVCLAHGLQLDGFKVLLVDTDAQRNSTLNVLANFPDENKHPYSTYDILFNSKEELRNKNIDVHEMIIHTEDCDIIPSSTQLAAIEPQIVGKIGKEYRLAEALKKVEDEYDFVIIDSPPVVGTISINDLTASDGVIIPVLADLFSLSALGEISLQIESVNEYLRKSNPVRVSGILLNAYDPKLTVQRETAEMFAETASMLNMTIYETYIRKSTTIAKSQAEMVNLWKYTLGIKRKDSYVYNGVNDYFSFIKEFMKKEDIPMKGNLQKYMKSNF